MKKLFYLLFLTLAAAATACGEKDEPTPPEPGPEPPAEVGRTVLVYMVAHNNLGQQGWDAADISEMRRAASTGGLHGGRLLVMHQASDGTSVLKEINGSGLIDTLKIYDSYNSSLSIRRMRDVFDDMQALAPARAYGLVLWSHGTGWLQNGMDDPDDRRRAFGVDGNTNKQMNVSALAKAVDGRGFDFIYFDCCHMASVEAAYEMRHATPLIVGSVAELPSPGMPYDENVPLLMQGKAVEAAANTFRYYDEKLGSDRTCTMTAIATAGLDRLAAAAAALYSTAAPLPEGTMPQKFERGATCRLFDLLDYAESVATDADALAEFRAALADAVIYQAATPKIFNIITVRRHCGLSTFVVRTPDDMTDRGYSSLQWAADVAATLPCSKQSNP